MPRAAAKPASATKVPTKEKKEKKASKSKKVKKEGEQKRRWLPGTVALREIRKLQKGTKLLLQKAPFQRLCRTLMAAHKDSLRFKPSALEAVQEAAEHYMVGLFEGAVILQLHRGKKTLNVKDLSYTRRIRGELVGQ